jgi:hypothetical protein
MRQSFYTYKITGLLLSVIAVFWLLLPCALHCELLTVPVTAPHSCCGENTADSPDPVPNSSQDNLKETCISNSNSIQVPVPTQYNPLVKSAFHSPVMTALDHPSNILPTDFNRLLLKIPVSFSLARQIHYQELFLHAPPIVS